MGWINPVPEGRQTRGFGPSPFLYDEGAHADGDKAHDYQAGAFPGSQYYLHFHAALDLAADTGTRIVAPQTGTVIDSLFGVPGTWANGGGWFLRIQVNSRCQYLVAHCNRLYVSLGQRVFQGQHIADVGSTGVATGPHTHFWTRLGGPLYYDPKAFYYDPGLVLPGGLLFGDGRFEPTATLPQNPPQGYDVNLTDVTIPIDTGRLFTAKAGTVLFNDAAHKSIRAKLTAAAEFRVIGFHRNGDVLSSNPGNPGGSPFLVPPNH